MNSIKAFIGLLAFFAIIFVIPAIVGWREDADGARRALEGAGYTKVEAGGFAWFGCWQEDWYHTRFIATGPRGQSVTGMVCSGLLFKGNTIRTD